jgi:CspA family cold shock protein
MGRNTGDRVPGVVKRLVDDKGFGFIRADNGVEYFFHSSASPDFHTLREGTAVTFLVGSGPKGPRAEAVEIA